MSKPKFDWAAKAALRYYGIWDNETKALAKLLRRAEKRGWRDGYADAKDFYKGARK
jgi:hypothetical protein